MRPIVREHNLETNEIIDREMTDEEFEAHKISQIQLEEIKKTDETRMATRQSALSKLIDLGLTEDEIAAL